MLPRRPPTPAATAETMSIIINQYQTEDKSLSIILLYIPIHMLTGTHNIK
jgi:hypothetical protein